MFDAVTFGALATPKSQVEALTNAKGAVEVTRLAVNE